MKIKGKEIKGKSRDFVLIPRADGDVVLWAEAVINFDEFRKLCPFPKAPVAIVKGGKRIVQSDDPEYLNQLRLYSERQTAYIILKSIDLPENELEWATVDMQKSNTWMNYEKEMKDAGFSFGEIKILIDKVFEVNAMSETKVAEARESFALRLEETGTDTSGQNTEQDSTKSGEPASAGE